MELLVVIGIIAILAALIFPAVLGLTARAAGVNCMANMRQVGGAFLAYRAEHNGWFPPGEAIQYSDGLGDAYEATFKNHLIPTYLPEKPYCPAMRLQNTPEARKRHPDEKKHLKSLGSYAINARLLSTKMEALPGERWDNRYPYPGDHRMLFLAESTSSGSVNAFFHPNSALKGYDVGSRMIAPRHHGKMHLNFMFLDGHIQLIGPEVTGEGADISFDWSKHFDNYGRDEKYVSPSTLPKRPPED